MESEDDRRGLVELCIEAASESRESVERWRRQRRTLELLPAHLAHSLFQRLLHRRLLYPSLLEVFQHCVEEIDLKRFGFVDAEWMAYLGAFRCLRTLNVAGCRGISDSALWPITGVASLEELDLSKCSKITDASIEHLLSIPNLKKLCASETRLSSDGIIRLGSLKKLHVLDLGGLPTTDRALRSLQGLTQLEYLDIWGSKISNEGATMLKIFPKLSYLNLEWTDVSKLPDLPSLTCLNMCNCTIHSIFEGGSTFNSSLAKLFVHGTTFIDEYDPFPHLQARCLSLLDLSGSSISKFYFLTKMGGLEHLDLSFGRMTDELIGFVASVGANLSYLNLSGTKVTSQGIGTLAGNLWNLKTLSLSQTSVDDASLQYIGMMPSLRVVDLSNTKIKGFCYPRENKVDRAFSLTALQNLEWLQSLNLEETHVTEEAMQPLGVLRELNHLSLKSDFLSDISLPIFSSLPNLKFLGFRRAVLTNNGLLMFSPPKMLHILDLRGCWLLTEDAIHLFHKRYPQIEVKHEFAHMSSVNQKEKAGSCLFQRKTQASHSISKLGKHTQSSCESPGGGFADERIKYTREELLELQWLPSTYDSYVLPGELMN